MLDTAPAQGDQSENLPLSGDISPVHDPAVIMDERGAHLFNTSHLGRGPGLIHWRTSSDLKAWTLEGAVFEDLPDWARDYSPETRGLWAPDIVKVSSEYRLYYSVSRFGQNRSAIGLATAKILDPSAQVPVWKDRGMVIASDTDDNYNAIDPNYLIDTEGRHWLSFGSFWSGLKILELDPVTGKPLAAEPELHAIAWQAEPPHDIEAPFIVERDGWYYLFASKGFCCRNEDSTYFTVVGRADNPTGPYLDRTGRDMMDGGGLTVLGDGRESGERFVGRGHPAILKDGEDFLIFYHAYDTEAGGTPTLRIRRLGWANGWPVAGIAAD